MKILGIDPGKATTGWGIIECGKKKIKYIDSGVIETDSDLEDSERLRLIFNEMNSLLRKFEPDVLAVEKLFFFKNVKTAIGVAQAKGVVLLAGARKDIPLYEFTPLEIKMAITGYGKAKKKQMQKMVQELLEMEEMPKPDDAADGLAVAISCNRKLNTKV